MLRHFVALLLLLCASPLLAADPAGHWAVISGDTVIMRFDIEKNGSGWSVSWVRPEHLTVNEDSFANIQTSIVTRRPSGVAEVDGDLELSFDDAMAGAPPTIVRIHAIDATRGLASLVGAPLDPLALTRRSDAPAIGPFDPQKRYVRLIERTTNEEMTRIFEADQTARVDLAHIDPAKLEAGDEGRRKRTQELLDTGQLSSGEDYLHAAFVFQHGGVAADYLKAHLLAMVAVARGQSSATWIASATLDRYLQAIGQPQVLGTQYRGAAGGPMTQDPYDPALISDPLRKALGVPPLSEQEAQRKRFEEQLQPK